MNSTIYFSGQYASWKATRIARTTKKIACTRIRFPGLKDAIKKSMTIEVTCDCKKINYRIVDDWIIFEKPLNPIQEKRSYFFGLISRIINKPNYCYVGVHITYPWLEKSKCF